MAPFRNVSLNPKTVTIAGLAFLAGCSLTLLPKYSLQLDPGFPRSKQYQSFSLSERSDNLAFHPQSTELTQPNQPNAATFAIVAMLGTESHLTRDKDRLSQMSCYASTNNIPYFIETATPSSSFWDKQSAVLKYLPSYDWIVYVDTDTYVGASASSTSSFPQP